MGGERREGCPRNRNGLCSLSALVFRIPKQAGSDCDENNNIPLKQDQKSTKRRTNVWSERDSNVRLSGETFRPSIRRLPAPLANPLVVRIKWGRQASGSLPGSHQRHTSHSFGTPHAIIGSFIYTLQDYTGTVVPLCSQSETTLETAVTTLFTRSVLRPPM
jgi:hypothetical protein